MLSDQFCFKGYFFDERTCVSTYSYPHIPLNDNLNGPITQANVPTPYPITSVPTPLTKNEVLVREVIIPHHPDFRSSKRMQNFALGKPEYLNNEMLVEDALVYRSNGSYTKLAVDYHADFSDDSDSKTASIRLAVKGNTSVGEITGVMSCNKTLKAGALRCTIYNPHQVDLMYYYLPKEAWLNWITVHPTSGIGKIVFYYNHKTQEIAKFEKYRCDSFVDLARRS